MSAQNAAACGWSLLDLATESARAEALRLSQEAAADATIGARALDLAWRLSNAEVRDISAYVLRDEGQPRGIALFTRRNRPLKFLLGEVAIGQAAFQRQWHVGEPYLSPQLRPEAASLAARELLQACLRKLGRRECLFFEGLPLDGALYSAIREARSQGARALTIELGAPYEHQFIRMPESFQEYIAQLGSRSRQSVQYSQRRLARDMDGQVRCECFETVESVERFVADAQAISKKTYQWSLLGLGLRDANGLRASLTAAARQGWMRSFILYCRDEPVAFMLGEHQAGCYYYDDVGYDPDFGKWSVGSVLQMYVLEHLYNQADKPRCFDFSTGYGEHKGRFGNYSRREASLLVMPASMENRALGAAYRASARVSAAAVDLLKRAGVKDRLKRLIRHRSSRKSEAA